MDALSQKFSDWLENLQRESWNLELIISGFSIFLLFQANEKLIELIIQVQQNYDLGDALRSMVVTLVGTMILGTGALIVNLIILIALRGIWIGTVGLRSVQKNIDIERLNYSDIFTRKLNQQLSSLDQLIVRLDTICSSIFAFTFLIFFMFLSFVAFFFWIVLLQQFYDLVGADKIEWLDTVFTIIVIAFNVLGFIYFIDTFTGGFFKKYRWLSKLYLPIYNLFTLATFSFFYRSIYYTFLSRYRKSSFCLLLFGYVFVVFNIPFFRFDQNLFYPDKLTTTKFYSSSYDNLRHTDTPIFTASIPSDRIKERFLPLFIRYQVENNAAIRKMCTDYEPSKNNSFTTGITLDGGIMLNDPSVDETDPVALLRCLTRTYQIYLNDSLLTQPQFFYFRHPNQDERGVRTMIDTKNLSAGQQQIVIKQWELEEDSLVIQDYETLRFWLQKMITD